MSDIRQTFDSSLGKKLIMALTGLFLSLFLIVHLIGNLQLFNQDNGQAFNEYSYFMTHFAPIKVVSYLLYISIIVHTVYAIVLTVNNRKARPVAYAVQSKSPVKWSSTNMGILGSVLFLFIVIHMGNFWFTYHKDEWFKNHDGPRMAYKEYRTDLRTGEQVSAEVLPQGEYQYVKYVEGDVQIVRAKDLQQSVVDAFSSPVYVLFYIIAMAALGFHLYHGFQSSFQSIGWNHRKYTPIIKFVGKWIFAILIPLGFAAMPIVYYFQYLNQ